MSATVRSSQIALACLSLLGCASPGGEPRAGGEAARPGVAPAAEPEAVSLLGERLYARDPGQFPALVEALEKAERDHRERPNDLDAVTWHGRRLGYLWRCREAIAVYSEGITRWPDEPTLYRHRGHRFISIRRFDLAIADLKRAVKLMNGREREVEPDGMPNERNIPLGTLAFNVWYHLALAQYLAGDFKAALGSWWTCDAYSHDYPDKLVATRYWMHLTLRRLGRPADAKAALDPITLEVDIIENHSYHALALLYKGMRSEDELLAGRSGDAEFAGIGYGLGMRQLLDGPRSDAVATFERVIATGNWPAFGFIAAEVELARLRANP